MSRDSILKEKSLLLAIRVINLFKYLRERQEFIISKQIIRAGTAIGASIREAEYAESKRDFLHKLYVSLKEANETIYWLDLLMATKFIEQKIYESIKCDVEEIMRMLIKSIKTIKARL